LRLQPPLLVHGHFINQALQIPFVVNGVLSANEFHKPQRVFAPNHQVGRPLLAVLEHNDAVARDWILARVHQVPRFAAVVAKPVFF
jgi:hypothetical protein